MSTAMAIELKDCIQMEIKHKVGTFNLAKYKIVQRVLVEDLLDILEQNLYLRNGKIACKREFLKLASVVEERYHKIACMGNFTVLPIEISDANYAIKIIILENYNLANCALFAKSLIYRSGKPYNNLQEIIKKLDAGRCKL